MIHMTHEDVVQILDLMKQSTIDELHLEIGNLKLRLKRFSEIRKVQVAAPAEEIERERFAPIKAPMLGFFFSAPKPGDPPFVELGQWVSEGDPVCLIEVLGQKHRVNAGVRGRIKRICIPDGEMVEFKQTLFLIEETVEKEEARRGKD